MKVGKEYLIEFKVKDQHKCEILEYPNVESQESL